VCGEREVIDRQLTDQRLDVSVVRRVLALCLRDGRDVRDETVESSAAPFRFDMEQVRLFKRTFIDATSVVFCDFFFDIAYADPAASEWDDDVTRVLHRDERNFNAK
jgi:hypothetical protein